MITIIWVIAIRKSVADAGCSALPLELVLRLGLEIASVVALVQLS
jgi:hypothetical protein